VYKCKSIKILQIYNFNTYIPEILQWLLEARSKKQELASGFRQYRRKNEKRREREVRATKEFATPRSPLNGKKSKNCASLVIRCSPQKLNFCGMFRTLPHTKNPAPASKQKIRKSEVVRCWVALCFTSYFFFIVKEWKIIDSPPQSLKKE